jgi:hypothetical protein
MKASAVEFMKFEQTIWVPTMLARLNMFDLVELKCTPVTSVDRIFL